jgi:hypothetical protein
MLMPMSHATTPLLSAFNNNVIDPFVPSVNLRSYVALSRPGIIRMEKPNETIRPGSREGPTALSGILIQSFLFFCLLIYINKLAKNQRTNPRTPYNSSAGDLKRIVPPLPPIKRSLTLGISPVINESENKK